MSDYKRSYDYICDLENQLYDLEVANEKFVKVWRELKRWLKENQDKYELVLDKMKELERKENE